MKHTTRILSICALCLLALGAMAQSGAEKTLLKEGDKLFDDGKMLEALPNYRQLVSIAPTNREYNFKYGATLLSSEEDPAEAVKHLNFSVKGGGGDPLAYYFLGKANHLDYRFADAISAYKRFDGLADSKLKAKYPDAPRLQEMAENGKGLLSRIKDISVLDKTESTVADFFRSYDMAAIGGRVITLPEELLSSQDKKNGHRPLIHFPDNGGRIYFSSYGSSDNLDIYSTTRSSSGTFSDPVRLNASVNTDYDEDYPFLHSDGTTLYFSSKGHNSMGGYDVFKSKSSDGMTFSKAENLDFAISSPDDDIFYMVGTDERSANFASTRGSEDGRVHVYRVAVQNASMSLAIIKGDFINEKGGSKKVDINVVDAMTNESLGKYKTAASSGDYLIDLPRAGKYTFYVDVEGSEVTHTGTVDIPPVDGMQAFKQEMSLVEVAGQEKLIIKNLFDQTLDEDILDLAQELLKRKSQLEVNSDEADIIVAVEDVNVDDVAVNAGFEQGTTMDDVLSMAKAQEESLAKSIQANEDDAAKILALAGADRDKAVEYSLKATQSYAQIQGQGDESTKEDLIVYTASLRDRSTHSKESAEVALSLLTDLEQDKINKARRLKELKVRNAALEEATASKDEATLTELLAQVRSERDNDVQEDALDYISERSIKRKKETERKRDFADGLRSEQEALRAKLTTRKTQLSRAKKDKEKEAISADITAIEAELVDYEDQIARSYAKLEEVQAESDATAESVALLEKVRLGGVDDRISGVQLQPADKEAITAVGQGLTKVEETNNSIALSDKDVREILVKRPDLKDNYVQELTLAGMSREVAALDALPSQSALTPQDDTTASDPDQVQDMNLSDVASASGIDGSTETRDVSAAASDVGEDISTTAQTATDTVTGATTDSAIDTAATENAIDASTETVSGAATDTAVDALSDNSTDTTSDSVSGEVDTTFSDDNSTQETRDDILENGLEDVSTASSSASGSSSEDSGTTDVLAQDYSTLTLDDLLNELNGQYQEREEEIAIEASNDKVRAAKKVDLNRATIVEAERRVVELEKKRWNADDPTRELIDTNVTALKRLTLSLERENEALRRDVLSTDALADESTGQESRSTTEVAESAADEATTRTAEETETSTDMLTDIQESVTSDGVTTAGAATDASINEGTASTSELTTEVVTAAEEVTDDADVIDELAGGAGQEAQETMTTGVSNEAGQEVVETGASTTDPTIADNLIEAAATNDSGQIDFQSATAYEAITPDRLASFDQQLIDNDEIVISQDNWMAKADKAEMNELSRRTAEKLSEVTSSDKSAEQKTAERIRINGNYVGVAKMLRDQKQMALDQATSAAEQESLAIEVEGLTEVIDLKQKELAIDRGSLRSASTTINEADMVVARYAPDYLTEKLEVERISADEREREIRQRHLDFLTLEELEQKAEITDDTVLDSQIIRLKSTVGDYTPDYAGGVDLSRMDAVAETATTTDTGSAAINTTSAPVDRSGAPIDMSPIDVSTADEWALEYAMVLETEGLRKAKFRSLKANMAYPKLKSDIFELEEMQQSGPSMGMTEKEIEIGERIAITTDTEYDHYLDILSEQNKIGGTPLSQKASELEGSAETFMREADRYRAQADVQTIAETKNALLKRAVAMELAAVDQLSEALTIYKHLENGGTNDDYVLEDVLVDRAVPALAGLEYELDVVAHEETSLVYDDQSSQASEVMANSSETGNPTSDETADGEATSSSVDTAIIEQPKADEELDTAINELRSIGGTSDVTESSISESPSIDTGTPDTATTQGTTDEANSSTSEEITDDVDRIAETGTSDAISDDGVTVRGAGVSQEDAANEVVGDAGAIASAEVIDVSELSTIQEVDALPVMSVAQIDSDYPEVMADLRAKDIQPTAPVVIDRSRPEQEAIVSYTQQLEAEGGSDLPSETKEAIAMSMIQWEGLLEQKSDEMDIVQDYREERKQRRVALAEVINVSSPDEETARRKEQLYNEIRVLDAYIAQGESNIATIDAEMTTVTSEVKRLQEESDIADTDQVDTSVSGLGRSTDSATTTSDADLAENAADADFESNTTATDVDASETMDNASTTADVAPATSRSIASEAAAANVPLNSVPRAEIYDIPTTLEAPRFLIDRDADTYTEAKPIPIGARLPDGLVYQVQVGAYRNPIPPEVFKGFAPIIGTRLPSGITRYTVGLFPELNTASRAKGQVRQLGYSDAFVVAYLNGQRISLQEAQAYGAEQEGSLAQTSDNTQTSTGTSNNTTDAQSSTADQSTTTLPVNAAQSTQATSSQAADTATDGQSGSAIDAIADDSNGSSSEASDTDTDIASSSSPTETQTGAESSTANTGSTTGSTSEENSSAATETAEATGTATESSPTTNSTTGSTVLPSTIDEELSATADRLAAEDEVDPTAYYETVVDAAPATQIETLSGLFFTVQVGVYSKPVSSANIYNISPLNSELMDNGLIKYTSGIFDDTSVAEQWKERMVDRGVGDAFITAYYNGERISVAKARRLSEELGEEVLLEVDELSDFQEDSEGQAVWELVSTSELFDEDEETTIAFKIRMGPYYDRIPDEEVKVILDFEDQVEFSQAADGAFIYSTKNKMSYNEARQWKTTYLERGIRNANIIAYDGDREIPVKQAMEILLK